MLLPGVGVVQTGDGQQHGPLGVGFADLLERLHDLLGGLVGGANGHDHQMGPRVEFFESSLAS